MPRTLSALLFSFRITSSCLWIVPTTVAVPLLLLAALVFPATVTGQATTDRTPNLSGGWVGEPGTVHFNVVHRFWIAQTGGDDKLINTPSMLVAVPLPGRMLLGAVYGTNSLVAPNRFNELEIFGRWALFAPGEGPLDVALGAGYNRAARSGDAEVSLATSIGSLPGAGSVRVIAAGRAFTDALGLGEPGWSLAAGLVVQPRDHLALSADLGTLRRDGEWSGEGRVWGAGLQFRIPATPHTVSLQATNTRTSTVQGSAGSAGARRTVWGFEFTVPFTLARYFPGRRGAGAVSDPAEARGDDVRVSMTELAFVPDTIRIQAGQTVVWENPTGLVHTVTADPERVRDPEQVRLPEGAEPFDSGNLFEGDEFRHTFTVPGEYLYICVPHDMVGMRGVVLVVPE